MYKDGFTLQSGLSPSLRGSGLKLFTDRKKEIDMLVSLFTREWIEIFSLRSASACSYVSLFTREWIEINLTSPAA